MRPDLRTEIGYGTLAGMRNLLALATIAEQLPRSRGKRRRLQQPARFLASDRAVRAFRRLSLLELLADKTSFAPDRIRAPLLVARAATGAVASASVAAAARKPRLPAALLGAAVALAATWASFHLRRFTTERTGVPDPIAGMGEDAIVARLCDRLAAARI